MIKRRTFLIRLYSAKLTIVFFLLLIVAVYLYAEAIIDFNALLAIFGGLITSYLGLSKQISEDDKVFRELFIDFNEKYSGETNDLFNCLHSGEKDTIEPDDRLLIIDYFNLSAEEFLWYKKGRIPYSVWKAWEAGIIENLSNTIVHKIFKEETDSLRKKDSYYGFVEYITPKL